MHWNAGMTFPHNELACLLARIRINWDVYGVASLPMNEIRLVSSCGLKREAVIWLTYLQLYKKQGRFGHFTHRQTINIFFYYEFEFLSLHAM